MGILIVLCLLMNFISAFTMTTNAAIVDSITNQYTYIRLAPYWTAQVVDEIAKNVAIKILERDYNYLYIQYEHSGTKRGYIPIDYTDASGYSWCNHSIFNLGYNVSNTSVTVRYGPSNSYESCGSIDSDEGDKNCFSYISWLCQ